MTIKNKLTAILLSVSFFCQPLICTAYADAEGVSPKQISPSHAGRVVGTALCCVLGVADLVVGLADVVLIGHSIHKAKNDITKLSDVSHPIDTCAISNILRDMEQVLANQVKTFRKSKKWNGEAAAEVVETLESLGPQVGNGELAVNVDNIGDAPVICVGD